MADGKWISYLRVSTDRQGKSGLGIEAQRNAVADYLNGGNWSLVKEFVEVGSGKRTDRPMLAEAIKACRVYGSMFCAISNVSTRTSAQSHIYHLRLLASCNRTV